MSLHLAAMCAQPDSDWSVYLWVARDSLVVDMLTTMFVYLLLRWTFAFEPWSFICFWGKIRITTMVTYLKKGKDLPWSFIKVWSFINFFVITHRCSLIWLWSIISFLIFFHYACLFKYALVLWTLEYLVQGFLVFLGISPAWCLVRCLIWTKDSED